MAMTHYSILLCTDKATGMEYKKGGSEIGKELAEKSKGLFSADDWQCKTYVLSCFVTVQAHCF